MHRPSPKHHPMMHNRLLVPYFIPYTWPISSKRRNKLQHILNGNIDRAEIKEFCEKLRFNDIQILIQELAVAFPQPTQWSKRAENSKTRSWLSTLGKFIDLMSGGESNLLWKRFLSSRPTFKDELSKMFTDAENARRLEKLHSNYRIIAPQLNRMDSISDSMKMNILMLMNDVLTKEQMLSAGSVVGEKIYKDMREHMTKNGPVLMWPENKKLQRLAQNLASIFESEAMLSAKSVVARRACLKLVNEVLTKDQIVGTPNVGIDAYKAMRADVEKHGFVVSTQETWSTVAL